jgi:Flp pilus assembly protein protease CpaA
MDLKDKRLWWGVAAVIIVLIVIGYAAGWFGGTPVPEPQQ